MTHTIGQQLRQAREAKRLSLEQVFESIRIRPQYLQALEDDDLRALPSPVQARGYLRNYADFLGLNFEQMLEELRSGNKPPEGIIGPMDLAAQPASPAPGPTSVSPAAPPPTPEPESVVQVESQPEVTPPQEEIPASKPRTTRRRKTADAVPVSDASPTVPKRRGRKKAEPAPELEPAPIIESQPQAESEPVIPVESEPVVAEESLLPQPEESAPQTDVREKLWQTWLNRISAAISARRARKTEAMPDETAQPFEVAKAVEPEPSPPASEPPASEPKESDLIFKEVGAELRKRRELLSLNLEEVERNTRVKAHYLDALERGAMHELPSTVQTRGMLSNYATFLDLDVDALLLRFADALQARHREKNPQKPPRKKGQPITASLPALTNFIAGDMVFGVGMAVLLVGFSIWAVSRVLAVQSEKQVAPTAPSISDVLLATPDDSSVTPTETLEPLLALPGEATVTVVIPTLGENVNVQVNLVAVERTYMRVVVDGRDVFNGRVVPGNAYPFEAQGQIEILVGSGAAIRIVYNGRDLGLMGGFGQVVNNIYLADGIITPTALPTTIPTNTPTPTATLRPTRTPVPSNTTVPSRTPSP